VTITSRPILPLMLFLFGLLDLLLVLIFRGGSDWGPLWAGVQIALTDPARLYDFEAVTRLQEPFFGPLGTRPFVYPPSALLWLMPFVWLPLAPAMIAFVGLSGLLLWRASRGIGASAAVMLAPPVVLAALVGQTSFLVGGLALAGLVRLRKDAIGAGILLGLAATIKPTLLILAPFALLAGGHYRALMAAGLSGLAVILVSILGFGLDPWLAWLEAIPRFQALFMAEEALVRTAVTPFALAVRFGFASPLVLVLCGGVALIAVMLVFRRCEDVAVRSVALLGGALIAAPYAMNYELALLAPAVMTLPLHRWRDAIVPALFALSLFATASAAGLALVYALFVARGLTSANDPVVKRRIDIAA
ncbi:MAG: DUF2029 domain-containing protein, partial [Sphingomonas bacterium]|nr:DUF2029 domain-containing protein [Sphingomonas bacterium]